MKRFVEGEDRRQATLLPDCRDDYVTQDNPVRVVEVYVEELDLSVLGFAGVVPEMTGRPAYHPATLLKIYLYGYLNRIQSSRRLERETQRNIELMWLTGRLMPDFKTIADFRKDNGPAIRAACAQFVVLCRRLNLFTQVADLTNVVLLRVLAELANCHVLDHAAAQRGNGFGAHRGLLSETGWTPRSSDRPHRPVTQPRALRTPYRESGLVLCPARVGSRHVVPANGRGNASEPRGYVGSGWRADRPVQNRLTDEADARLPGLSLPPESKTCGGLL